MSRRDATRARRPSLVVVVAAALALVVGCSSSPSTSSLQQKLRQVNGLSAFQAKCVATGLEHALTAKEMRQVAAARRARRHPRRPAQSEGPEGGVELRVRTQHHPARARLVGVGVGLVHGGHAGALTGSGPDLGGTLPAVALVRGRGRRAPRCGARRRRRGR